MPDPPSTAEGWLYWIVQPLTRGIGTPGEGFESFFYPPYMGRSEYEQPGTDLTRLYEKAGGAPVIEAYQITAPPTSRPVYFVGPDIAPSAAWHRALETLPAKARAMEVWLRDGGETKMPCWFAECFHGATKEIFERLPVIAWWAMQHDFMFTLDPTVANDLREAIQTTRGSFGQLG